MNFRRRRGHVESPRTALTSRAKRASLAGRRRRTEQRGERFGGVGMPTAGTGGEGRGTVDPGRRGGKKVRARPSERAGAEAGRRDATRRARRMATWRIGRPCAVHATRQRRPRDPHGRRASDPTDTADTHGCTENGAADRRRKESRFAVPEEMKRDGRGAEPGGTELARARARATERDG